jgi:hypothetical protein
VSQGEFCTNEVWACFTDLLRQQLDGVDVQSITSKDFSDDGELILNPPSVRSFFAGEGAASTSDTQRLSYNVVGRYIVLCANEDLRDPAAQAKASLNLAGQVKAILAGARLLFPDGETSEPITYVGMEPEPVDGLGVAYAAAFEVPGLAQFAGANAWPTQAGATE